MPAGVPLFLKCTFEHLGSSSPQRGVAPIDAMTSVPVLRPNYAFLRRPLIMRPRSLRAW